jgi:FkbM family methyltransferase
MRIAGQVTWVHPRVLTSIATLTQPNIIRWIDEHLQPGDTFLDVGANCGWLSIRAARRVGRGGRVIAFEPSPILVDILRYHAKVNRLPQIIVVPKAVSDSDNEAPFFLLNGGFSFRNSLTIGRDDVPFVRPEDKLRITVPTVTLDRYCAQHDLRPALVKIDVEGAELEVLEGCRELLRQARPVIIVGVHPHWLPAGQSADQILALLSDSGYRVKDSLMVPRYGYQIGDYLYEPRTA